MNEVLLFCLVLSTFSTLPLVYGQQGSSPAGRLPAGTFTVVAIGDVLPGVAYDAAIQSGQNPFRHLTPQLSGADLALANLETPLSDRGTRALGKKFTFRVPPGRARLLAGAGLDVLGLANNHILDYGPQALQDTTEALSRFGLLWCGAGRHLGEARQPARWVVQGKRVAVLAYNRTYPLKFWASETEPGTAYADLNIVREDITRARRANDVVIVLVHWGREKQHTLRPYQRPVARAAIEAGASLVIGAHPHVMQGVERIGPGVAVYSLGDGVFGGAHRRTEDGLMLRAVFGPSGLREVEFFALQTSNRDTDYAPRIRMGEAALEPLALVIRLAAQLGTTLTPGASAEGFPCARLVLAE